MKSKNEYWNLSWWYIFDFLDKKAHFYAKNNLGSDCVTAKADIIYKVPLNSLSNKLISIKHECTCNKKINVNIEISYKLNSWEKIIFVQANFIFVKINKLWKN